MSYQAFDYTILCMVMCMTNEMLNCATMMSGNKNVMWCKIVPVLITLAHTVAQFREILKQSTSNPNVMCWVF